MNTIKRRILIWRQRTRLRWWGKLALKIGGAWDCGPLTLVLHSKGLTLAWKNRIVWAGEIGDPPYNDV